MSMPRGETALEQWRRKLPLDKVLDGSLDRRTLVGLKRARDRKFRRKETSADGQLLANYVDLIGLCTLLDPEHFPGTSDSDIARVVEKLNKEDIIWTNPLQYRLLMRRVSNLLEAKDTPKLIEVLDPFQVQTFCPLAPTLSNISTDTEDKKMKDFRKLLMQDSLSPLLVEGEPSAGKVKELCRICIEKFENIDALDLGNVAASTLTSSMTIWRAIHALLVPTAPLDRQEPGEDLDCHWTSLQEDVLALKASIGSTRSSTLATIAAAVQTSPYYNQLLEEYVKTLPNHIQFESQLVEHKAKLTNMKEGLVMDDLPKLLAILEQLPMLLAALRHGALEHVLSNIECAIMKAWELSEKETLSLEHCQTLSRVLVEASVVWPQEAWYQEKLLAAGALVQKSGVDRLCKDIFTARQEVETCDLEEKGKMLNSMSGLVKLLSTASVQQSLLVQGEGQHWVTIQNKSLTFLDQHWVLGSGPTPPGVGAQEVNNLNKEVGKLLEGQPVGKRAKALDVGLQLISTHEKILKERITEGCVIKNALPVTQALERQIKQYQSILEQSEKHLDHAVFVKLQVQYKAAEKTFSQTKQFLQTQSQTLVTKLQKDLAKVAQGQADGESWQKGVETADWEDVIKKANTTILQLQGKTLVDLIDKLEEALLGKHSTIEHRGPVPKVQGG
eukprot:6490745-Amphidinium_carterae.2